MPAKKHNYPSYERHIKRVGADALRRQAARIRRTLERVPNPDAEYAAIMRRQIARWESALQAYERSEPE